MLMMSSDKDNPFKSVSWQSTKPVAQCTKCNGDVFYDYSIEIFETPPKQAIVICWDCGQQYELIDGEIK